MKQRIIGIDVARALAVIGMIIVNFKVVLGEKGNGPIKSLVSVFDGKAAATFVVLAGLGLALMTNSALKNQDGDKLKKLRTSIAKRALFLFLIGLSYIAIWPADILHFYGVYMIFALFLMRSSQRTLIIVALCFILAFPLLMMVWDYSSGWNFASLEYEGFWTFEGFMTNLFFNGFHPVIPWTAFMLVGYWFGQQDLYDHRFLKRTFFVSTGIFVGIQFLSRAAIIFLSEGNPQSIQELSEILGTQPMPPLPIYMFNGISISLAVITACILIAKRFEDSLPIRALYKTGQLALTFYVAHVVLGMGLIEVVDPDKMGSYPITFSLVYALSFSTLCILFAALWLRYFKSGPLEWVFRKLTR